MKNMTKPCMDRRAFIKGLAVAGVAGSVGAGTSQNARAEQIGPTSIKQKTRYRETQHIRDYYDSL